MRDVGERPAWDERQAASLVGATVLIGITRLRADGSEQEQMFGTIISANARRGFEIAPEGSREGEIYWLPPDHRNFFPAQPGEYRLRSTGEIVTDPTYTSTWTINPGPQRSRPCVGSDGSVHGRDGAPGSGTAG